MLWFEMCYIIIFASCYILYIFTLTLDGRGARRCVYFHFNVSVKSSLFSICIPFPDNFFWNRVCVHGDEFLSPILCLLFYIGLKVYVPLLATNQSTTCRRRRIVLLCAQLLYRFFVMPNYFFLFCIRYVFLSISK